MEQARKFLVSCRSDENEELFSARRQAFMSSRSSENPMDIETPIRMMSEDGRDVDRRDEDGRDVDRRDEDSRDVDGRDEDGRDVDGRDVDGTQVDKRVVQVKFNDDVVIKMEVSDENTSQDGAKICRFRSSNHDEEESPLKSQSRRLKASTRKSTDTRRDRHNQKLVKQCEADFYRRVRAHHAMATMAKIDYGQALSLAERGITPKEKDFPSHEIIRGSHVRARSLGSIGLKCRELFEKKVGLDINDFIEHGPIEKLL